MLQRVTEMEKEAQQLKQRAKKTDTTKGEKKYVRPAKKQKQL